LEFDLRVGEGQEEPLSISGTWLNKGDKIRYAHSIQNELRWENSYDGKETRTLWRNTGGKHATRGEIRRDEPRFTKAVLSIPYITGRTPFGMSLLEALEAGNAGVEPNTVKMDDHDCYVVKGHMLTEERDGIDSMFFKYWLDPNYGFMPRRSEEYAYDEEGVLVWKNVRRDYTYSEVAPDVWFPASLTVEALKLGENGDWQSVTVNRWEAKSVSVNQNISDEMFRIEFPPGTHVLDYVSPDSEEYVEYIVTTANAAETHLEGGR
jgi:hypothetical protein